MPFVKVKIVRYEDLAFPGWVACSMIDAHGNEHVFVDKVPMVTAANLHDAGSLPQPGFIACIVVGTKEHDDGRPLSIIDTQSPWGIESSGGQTLFEVLSEQLCERPSEDSAG